MRKIKTGDDVIVITGKDKGKRGNVVRMLHEENRVVVENVNMAKRHTKPNPMRGVAGGIVQREMPIHISNVALFNPATKKADRVGVRTLSDGRRVRFFKSNSEVVDV